MIEWFAFIAVWWTWKVYNMPSPCLDSYRQDVAACAVHQPGTLARQVCESEALGRYEGCLLSPPQPIQPPPEPPPYPCWQSARIDWWCGDYNLDGGVDGADVGDFWSDWNDGVSRTDVDGDGYAGTDCDWVVFMAAWGDGSTEGCF